MARFLVWVDLHDEFWNRVPDIPDSAQDVDALLLAGDTSTQGRHIDIALDLHQQLNKPVIMIRGNHEFYHSTISGIIDNDRRRLAEINAAGGDIRMLEGNATEIAGTRIIGATLWTDLNLYPGHANQIRKAVKRNMNDFGLIRITPGQSFTVGKWLEMHWAEREAIFRELSISYDGPTIIMTHHIPVKEVIHPMRQVGAMENYLGNAGFASDMFWQIRNHDISSWICGHSHDNHSAEIRGEHGIIPFITNSRGYPREQQQVEFDPGFILDTNEPKPKPKPEPNPSP